MEFPEVFDSMGSFQGLIKSEVEFPTVTNKYKVQFPGVFLFGLEISQGS